MYNADKYRGTIFELDLVMGFSTMSEFHDIPLEGTYTRTADAEVGVEEKPDIIKVSARSRSTAVAGAIAGVIRQHEFAEVQAIGAGAVNQAVKALAIARGYLERDELDIVCTPYFTEVDIDGNERTAVRFRVEVRGNIVTHWMNGTDTHE